MSIAKRKLTPYADLLVEFQETLDKYVQTYMAFERSRGSLKDDSGLPPDQRSADLDSEFEKAREARDAAKVVVLQKFNKILTDLQKLQTSKGE